jgi:hypothetical protein
VLRNCLYLRNLRQGNRDGRKLHNEEGLTGENKKCIFLVSGRTSYGVVVCLDVNGDNTHGRWYIRIWTGFIWLNLVSSGETSVNILIDMRFEVLKAVKITMLLFWVVTPGFGGRYRHFGETYCLSF